MSLATHRRKPCRSGLRATQTYQSNPVSRVSGREAVANLDCASKGACRRRSLPSHGTHLAPSSVARRREASRGGCVQRSCVGPCRTTLWYPTRKEESSAMNLYVIKRIYHENGVGPYEAAYVAKSTMCLGDMHRLLRSAEHNSGYTYTVLTVVRPAYWILSPQKNDLVDLLGAIDVGVLESHRDIEDVNRELTRREAERACKTNPTEPPTEQ